MNKTFILTSRFQLIAAGILMSLAVAVGMVSLAGAAETQGVEQSSLTLSPAKNKFTIDAGKELSDALKVINTGDQPVEFILYARPYQVNGESYDASFNGTAPNSDAYKWVRFDQTSFTLEAGKNIDIPYRISVPEGIAPGGHYGVIFVETKAPEGDGQAVVRNKRLGMTLLATVNGQFRTGGEYLGTESPLVQFRSPLSTTTRIKNTGNADFGANLTMTVSDVFGSVKYRATKEFTVYPDTTRAMKMEWANSPWFGLFKVSVESKYLDETRTDESYVMILPRWMLLVLGVALLVGVIYVVRLRR